MARITVDDVHFFYTAQGPASALQPALVLLHGSGGDSSVWHAQIEALADARRVIAVDLPGHGQSGGKTAACAEHYAHWLKLLTEALKLPPFVLAGHSMGGSIAQQFAHIYPEALTGLILAGTGLRFEIPAGYRKLLRQNFDEACMVSCQQAYAGPMTADVIERGRAMLLRNGPDVLARDLDLCAGFDSTAWAKNLALPCLILCGAQDAITPCALSQRLADAIPVSTLRCVEAAGHMVMQEQPDLFNREISGFMAHLCRENPSAEKNNR
ncbi:MAG: alpha/beta hydrolase [Deltaproteobacteria bacterium]|nr:alpha/beta hydrolase [Deltaproteobacteria bacterium]